MSRKIHAAINNNNNNTTSSSSNSIIIYIRKYDKHIIPKLKNMANRIQLLHISHTPINNQEKGNHHIQELHQSYQQANFTFRPSECLLNLSKMNKTHLDAKHVSNHPQSFLGIFVFLIKMKPREYIGRNIQLVIMSSLKQYIKVGIYDHQI